MKPATALMVFTLIAVAPTAQAGARHDVIVVVGAAGNDAFAGRFKAWANAWHDACKRGQANHLAIGLDGKGDTDKQALQAAIASAEGEDPLWLVLIGHGTDDGRTAKFNLRGPDVTAKELASWLENTRRPIVLVNNASASAPFIRVVSRPGRVVISATKSGHEINATRFGGHLAGAIADPTADLDHDGQTSVLEAFLSAAHAVAASYKKDGRIATEHPLIDDNGDGLGTRADWFKGVRATKKAAGGASADGVRAHQIHLLPSAAERAIGPDRRAERDRLEFELAALRAERKAMGETAYYQKLETIMLKLARIYQTPSTKKPAEPDR